MGSKLCKQQVALWDGGGVALSPWKSLEVLAREACRPNSLSPAKCEGPDTWHGAWASQQTSHK